MGDTFGMWMWALILCSVIFIPLTFIIPALTNNNTNIFFTDEEVCKDFRANNSTIAQLCEEQPMPTLVGAIYMIILVIAIGAVITWCIIGFILLVGFINDRY
jgi:hypothetical protein